ASAAAYDTIVGARACTPAGGHRQRICLARALIQQPYILLPDEPPSAVDPASASMIHDAIDSVQAGKTILMISHQLLPDSDDSDFDQILTLRDRKICVSAPREHRVRLTS